jgi:DNA-binding SARP family transcriptional activator
VQALEVSLFGGFQLRRGDEAVPPMPSRAARSLLAYLAVHRGIRQPRDRLVELLWPDQPGNRGRRRLSHTLWQIQDALSELDGQLELLTVSPEAIVIDPAVPCRVDVERFEAGLDQAKRRRGAQEARLRDLTDLESAVALYRGEFLAGHDDAWVRAEQERLHQRYLEALGWLVGLAKAHTAYDDALVYARRLTNEDPLREDAHREVMRLSVLLGRTSDAIRQFERVREVLAEEMGAQPSAETAELHQRIVRQRELAPATPEPTPFPERVPLMGRDRGRGGGVAVF